MRIMAEYIDREALKNDGHLCWHDGKGNVFYEVDHAPAADVVEVVRCKACRYFGEEVGVSKDGVWAKCYLHKRTMCEINFCSYGVRKGEGE